MGVFDLRFDGFRDVTAARRLREADGEKGGDFLGESARAALVPVEGPSEHSFDDEDAIHQLNAALARERQRRVQAEEAYAEAASALEALRLRVQTLEQEGIELLNRLRQRDLKHQTRWIGGRVMAAENEALRAEVEELRAALEAERMRIDTQPTRAAGGRWRRRNPPRG